MTSKGLGLQRENQISLCSGRRKGQHARTGQATQVKKGLQRGRNEGGAVHVPTSQLGPNMALTVIFQ